MKKYTINLNETYVIEADSEEEAFFKFWDYINDCGEAEIIKVEEAFSKEG